MSQRKDAVYTKRGVRCPKAQLTGRDKGVATPGDLIVFYEGLGDANQRYGRVLGRVDAKGYGDCPKVVGHIRVLALSNDASTCYERWVDPNRVAQVLDSPHEFAAWFFQEKLPYTADILVQLSEYGTLSEAYIHNADLRVEEIKKGVLKG